MSCEQIALHYSNKCDALTAERDRYKDALQKIQYWASAYPLDVFPEPDFKKVHEVLKVAGISLDAVSASNMRHVINGVKDIIEQALKEQDGKEAEQKNPKE